MCEHSGQGADGGCLLISHARSLAFEALESSSAGVLQGVLANLLEPIPAAELATYPRARCVPSLSSS